MSSSTYGAGLAPIERLPQDIWNLIDSQFSVTENGRLHRVSRAMNHIMSNNIMWRARLARDFPWINVNASMNNRRAYYQMLCPSGNSECSC